MTLLTSNFDKHQKQITTTFGILIKDEQYLSIFFIVFTILVFHFDMSGNTFNASHPSNNPSIFSNLSAFHLDISKIIFNSEQL